MPFIPKAHPRFDQHPQKLSCRIRIFWLFSSGLVFQSHNFTLFRERTLIRTCLWISRSDAKMMVARVQELSERKGPDEDDEVWSPLFTLLDGLKVFLNPSAGAQSTVSWMLVAAHSATPRE